jgi:adenylate cyclase
VARPAVIEQPAKRILIALNLRFRSFRTRVLSFIVGLLVATQAGVFIVVNTANINNARRVIDEALVVAASVFEREIADRQRELLLAARLLSNDFAFKEAYATDDHATILSALKNHRERIGADVMNLVSMDGRVIADTLNPSVAGTVCAFPQLIDEAEHSEFGEASDIAFINDTPYQMVVVPLYLPEPDAWVSIGFRIDNTFVDNLKKTTLSHVSLLRSDSGTSWRAFASTLPSSSVAHLPDALSNPTWEIGQSSEFALDNETYVSLVTPLIDTPANQVVAVLQRPLKEALKPYLRLRVVLIGLFAAGIVLSVIGAALIARTVTRPVLKLAAGARRIAEGDYEQTVEISQQDEIGVLADTFNHMGRGLAERDRVRDLLGKVVSPEIAEELLAKDIELGGEEREVSILFADVRDFTGLCENRSPQQILEWLNNYLTKVSAVVEANRGVVDKFVGDCMMALYGVPLRHDDDADRAVNTALGMCEQLRGLNEDFERRGWPRVRIGVGINTAQVVVGNMGSTTRMNYTVIGDGVNVASRLESLSKNYGAAIVVSAATKAAAPRFVYRELDLVRVMGKAKSVAIYQPLGLRERLEDDVMLELKDYHTALYAYRAQEWETARSRFSSLRSKAPACLLYQVYLKRLERFCGDPPGPDWDGVFTYTEK